MRPEFVDQVMNLRKWIFSSTKIKEVDGQELSGEMLAILAQQYIDAFNFKKIPSI